MIGIITAMKEEAKGIIKKYKLIKEKEYLNIKIYGNKNIKLILTGIGKIQASLGTSILIQNYNLEKIINIGIAGFTGNKKSNIGDIFLINKVYQHDGYLPFNGKHLNYFKKGINLKIPIVNLKEKFNIINGICASGDQFIDNKNKIEIIKNTFNADVVEMEAFAVASVVKEFNLLDNLYIIKAISDDGSENAIKDHEKNLELAMQNSIKVLENIIEK